MCVAAMTSPAVILAGSLSTEDGLGRRCTSVGKTLGQGIQDWENSLVPRHEDGHSLLLFFFNTFPFVEEVACRRVKQLQLFLGL